jgi:hypothetical protein
VEHLVGKQVSQIAQEALVLDLGGMVKSMVGSLPGSKVPLAGVQTVDVGLEDIGKTVEQKIVACIVAALGDGRWPKVAFDDLRMVADILLAVLKGLDIAVQPNPLGRLKAFQVSLAVCGLHLEAVARLEGGVEH